MIGRRAKPSSVIRKHVESGVFQHDKGTDTFWTQKCQKCPKCVQKSDQNVSIVKICPKCAQNMSKLADYVQKASKLLSFIWTFLALQTKCVQNL